MLTKGLAVFLLAVLAGSLVLPGCSTAFTCTSTEPVRTEQRSVEGARGVPPAADHAYDWDEDAPNWRHWAD